MQETEEKQITSTLVRDLLKEKRADRRWRNIRFLLGFLLFAFALVNIFNLFNKNTSFSNKSLGSKYVSLIRLEGMIAPGRDLAADEVIPSLHDAFSDKNAEGVVIEINSPGGTPVQAAMIHDAILAYKKKYHKKVIVVGEDLLTSGAYYVAVAADKIYVNPSTLTGSIGVIIKGFGFVDLMKKIGVERRVYTVGAEKDRLDPFLPQNPEDTQKIQQVMNEVHQQFARAVLEGRKGKLKASPDTLFTGDFWSGQSAMNLGLIDALGNLMGAMEKEFNTTHYKEYGSSSSLFRLLGAQLSSAIDNFVYLN